MGGTGVEHVPLLLLLFLHKHNQVETSCWTSFPPTISMFTSLDNYILWKDTIMYSHHFLYTHIFTYNCWNPLKPFFALARVKMTIISSSIWNLSLCILLVLFMNINIVEDLFPLGSISCTLKTSLSPGFSFPFLTIPFSSCCYLPQSQVLVGHQRFISAPFVFGVIFILIYY